MLGMFKSRPPRDALDPNVAIRPGTHVSIAEGDGRSVLMDLQSGRYFGLDEVGTSIWRHVVEHRTPEQIFVEIEKEFDAPGTQARDDSTRFLNTLLDLGLVEQ